MAHIAYDVTFKEAFLRIVRVNIAILPQSENLIETALFIF